MTISPLAKPVSAMDAALKSPTAMGHAEALIDTSASMGEMPCCPNDAPAGSDCAKDCPLMTMCMVTTMLDVPAGPAVPAQFAMASILFSGDESNLDSRHQSPPAKPPKA